MSLNEHANNDSLRIGAELGDYRIIRLLGQSPTVITYLAFDRLNSHNVIIREFYPAGIATRGTDRQKVLQSPRCREEGALTGGVDDFVNYVQALKDAAHSNIVPVRSLFRAQGTAYCVLPEIAGLPLNTAAPPPSVISERWLMPILKDILSTVIHLHSQGIRTGNLQAKDILMANGQTPVIINLRATTSPRQQSAADDMQAIAHLCYSLITGTPWNDDVPPLCTISELRERFSTTALTCIDNVLTSDPVTRCHSIDEWLAAIPAPKESPPPSSGTTKQKRRFPVLGFVIVLGLLAVGAYYLYLHPEYLFN